MEAAAIVDVLVIGAGLMGSSTAYYAARQLPSSTHRPRVLVLEQYHLLHRRGSSHGESRITRRTYPSRVYTKLMKQAFELWEQAQDEAGVRVYQRHGGIDVLPADAPVTRALLDACTDVGAPVEVLSAAQLRRTYGLDFPATRIGVYQRDTGILRASATVAMFQALARKHGAAFREHSEVTSCVDVPASSLGVGDGVITRVSCKDGYTVLARRVVVACGPWAGPVLARVCGLSLKLQVWQCTVMYFKARQDVPGSEERLRQLPVLIDYADSSVWTSAPLQTGEHFTPFYSCPHGDFPGLIKFAIHEGVRTTADARTFTPNPEKTVIPVQRWLQTHVPFLDPHPVMSETCLYTMTPEEDFVVDLHPDRPNIVIAAGFSGHGFKFGSLIGDACAELALTGACARYDLSAFSIRRPCLELTRVDGARL